MESWANRHINFKCKPARDSGIFGTSWVVTVIIVGMNLLAANYYHPNGHTMPFLIGLEYSTYRWMNQSCNFEEVDTDPKECEVCHTDFTTNWIQMEQQTLCELCSKQFVKNKISKRQKRKIRETIVSTFIAEHSTVSQNYDRKEQAKRQKLIDQKEMEEREKKREEQRKIDEALQIEEDKKTEEKRKLERERKAEEEKNAPLETR